MEELGPRNVEIDGTTYRLRRWGPDDGDRWFFRLSQLMLSASGEHGSDMVAAMEVLHRIDEATFIAFRDVCFRYTDLIGSDEQGRETVRPLDKARATMRGNYVALLLLMRAHIEAEFRGPFSRIGEVLAGVVAGRKS